MKERALGVARGFAVLLGIGIAYYVFYRLTNIGIRCPTNLIFGILCPTCGVSRMFLALSQSDLRGALYYNAAVLVLLPLLLAVLVSYYRAYIVTGERKFKRWHRVALTVAVVILVAYGVMRNTMHIGLHPSDNSDYEFTKAIFWRIL